MLLGILLIGAPSAQAANHYVRAGATGSASGNDWTNAYTALPSSLIRGDTYYIADGSYAGYIFNTAASGTTLITIKKTVITDHDKIFVSRNFQHVCANLGVTIHRARIHRPTDKSMIENVFGYINENFAARLPGYKGADVASRGIGVEKSAFYFLEEIDAMFAEWVATDWQNHVSRTLILPELPALRLSPNEAYAEGLAKSGIMPIPIPEWMAWRRATTLLARNAGSRAPLPSRPTVSIQVIAARCCAGCPL